MLNAIKTLIGTLDCLPIEQKIESINFLKLALHDISPFKAEPVDCVLWVKNDAVTANDYNPNTVAPPEMELLATSIGEDGYTQPIVTWQREDIREVVDGFHRHRVGKEKPDILERIHGYLPVVTINAGRTDLTDRMASTIRHNRARGKHRIEAMSDIVIELKRRNWTDERIAKNLGMDQDEILRLCQITGLADLFSDQEFSSSWDIEGDLTEDDFIELTDDVTQYGEETGEFRAVNTSDSNRKFHTYDQWECYKAGFYNTTANGMKKTECETAYKEFLSDASRFSETLGKVITEWKYSCEHYLTNAAMNRLAWLGQASACYALGIPSSFRGGFNLLTNEEQDIANNTALIYLNKWLTANGMDELTMEQAYDGRQSDIY